MPRWGRAVTTTTEDARRFWESASLDVLHGMMEPAWAWEAWLRVAAGVITRPGTVFEPGCGIGVLAGLLPEGCAYYGCDLNPAYIREARRRRPDPAAVFEVRDLEDVLASGQTFDWVVVTSLFGMFPEAAAYEMMPRFWEASRLGLAMTTIDKRAFAARRRPQGFEFSGHEPDRLLEAGRALPGVGKVELVSGRDLPQFRAHHWRFGLALYAWRAE
jgi:SAM-dependent methyltransferase